MKESVFNAPTDEQLRLIRELAQKYPFHFASECMLLAKIDQMNKKLELAGPTTEQETALTIAELVGRKYGYTDSAGLVREIFESSSLPGMSLVGEGIAKMIYEAERKVDKALEEVRQRWS